MNKSVYISRKVLNYNDIIEWAISQGFTSILPIDNLHITVVYCKHKIDWNILDRNQPELIEVDEDKDHKRAVHQFDGGATVLEIFSDELTERNAALRAQGIYSKFPDYRAHITITYDLPSGSDVENIEPYRGPVILGPEILEEASNGWMNDFEELDLTLPLKEAVLADFDQDKLYDIFKKSYEGTTGASWSKEKFLNRAKLWTFYGDENGYIAFRVQRNGMRKLVGVAGDGISMLRGMQKLLIEGRPVWGAVSERLAQSAKKLGMIAPHTYPGGPFIIKLLMNNVPADVFAGTKPTVNPDGSLTFKYDDVGTAHKYLIANKEYFRELLNNRGMMSFINNNVVVKFLNSILRK